MSDYIFMLESHLDGGQNQVVAAMRQIATAANMNVWLTGGAMRDMLRGAPSRDLDFTVERDAIKTGRAMAESLGGRVVAEDPLKRWVELELPGGLPVSVGNARTEKYSKPGGKPHIAPATIHEDLARRDFTINAIALSLSRGSRGLLVDPANGQADLAGRELRTTNSYAFFDDPSRIFRLIRFQQVLGFSVAERTKSQMENAIAEGYHAGVPPQSLGREIRALALEPCVVAALEAYDGLGLLKLLSPALTGAGMNASGLMRFERLKQSVIPYASSGGWLAFVTVLTEKLSAREKAEVLKGFEMSALETAELNKLAAQAKKLEAALRSPKIHRPSDVWGALRDASTDEVLMVLYTSAARVVQDRVRAFYEKYLPQAREVTEEQVAATGAKPGTARFRKAWQTLIAARLNARPRKAPPAAEPEPIAPTVAVVDGRGRRQA
jgi:tRNA nucleotidyltransferase/poly(A) polymerase